MQGFGTIECGPPQISWSQPHSWSEVSEPIYLDGNPKSTHLNTVDKQGSLHEPPVIPSIMVECFRCTTGRVIAEEPHA